MKNNNNIITAKIFWFFLAFFILNPNLFAQEIKIPFSEGKVILEGGGNLNIEGYEGKDVLIYEMIYELNRPDMEKGLTLISSNKPKYEKVDIEYKIEGKVLKISAQGRSGRYHLKVPRSLDFSIKTQGSGYYYYDGLKNLNFENLTGELDVYSKGGIDVNIKNCTGSMSIVTYGNIAASFEKLPSEGALSFDTYLGHVNLSLPENGAANFSMTAKKGKIFSNLPLDVKSKKGKETKVVFGRGGIDIIINSEAGGDIYLRKIEK